MTKTKRWCAVCNFMTYGDCHPVTQIQVPRDIVLEKRFALSLLAFSQDGITGQSTCNIAAHPQLAGRPLHLAVDPQIAPDFKIIDLKIGMMSQFAAYSPGGVGASCFQPQPKEGPRNNLFGIDTFMPGHILVLTVQNIHHCARNFSALMHVQTIRGS